MAVRDILIFGVVLFAISIGFFIINFGMNTAIDSMIGNSAINSSNSTVTALQATQNNALNRLDLLVGGLFIGLILSLIITSWFIGGNPLFIFIYFIVIIIGVVVGAFLSNVWETMTGLAVFGSTITHFSVANNIMLNLPIYIAIAGFIGIIIMFAKPMMTSEY